MTRQGSEVSGTGARFLHLPQGHSTGALPAPHPAIMSYLPGSPLTWRGLGRRGADDGAQQQERIEAAVAPLRARRRPGRLPTSAENKRELSTTGYI